MIDPEIVSLNFSRAAPTYGQAAEFQRFAAESLAEFLPHAAAYGKAPRRILEIGCGTGFLTGLIFGRFPRAEFLVTDISGRMLDACMEANREVMASKRINARFQLCDAARQIPGGPFDLVVSGLAFQWMPDLGRTLDAVRSSMAGGGILAFSTLAAGTFLNLRRAFDEHHVKFPGPDFLDKREIRRLCSGFSSCRISCGPHEYQYPSLTEFLRQLRRIGAVNATGRPVPTAKMRRIIRSYQESFPSGDLKPFSTAYELVRCVCKK